MVRKAAGAEEVGADVLLDDVVHALCMLWLYKHGASPNEGDMCLHKSQLVCEEIDLLAIWQNTRSQIKLMALVQLQAHSGCMQCLLHSQGRRWWHVR